MRARQLGVVVKHPVTDHLVRGGAAASIAFAAHPGPWRRRRSVLDGRRLCARSALTLRAATPCMLPPTLPTLSLRRASLAAMSQHSHHWCRVCRQCCRRGTTCSTTAGGTRTQRSACAMLPVHHTSDALAPCNRLLPALRVHTPTSSRTKASVTAAQSACWRSCANSWWTQPGVRSHGYDNDDGGFCGSGGRHVGDGRLAGCCCR